MRLNQKVVAKITRFCRNRVTISSSGFSFPRYLLRLITKQIGELYKNNFFIHNFFNVFKQHVLRASILDIILNTWALGNARLKENHSLPSEFSQLLYFSAVGKC